MSRFNVQREQLSGYIQNAIMCIELGTNLKFTRAEDWTSTNQGHALHFAGNLYKGEQTWDDVVTFIKMQFAHNPETKCIDEDTSDFEELALGSNFGEHTTLVEGYTKHRTEVNFVDCDFCSTIWSNIEDFKHIYTEMKKQDRTQYLAITVSLRQVGMRRTLEYLAQFEEFGITEEDCKEIQSHRVASSKDLKHERSHVHRLCKGDKALNIYSYSDTGTPMLAGIIKIN